MAEAEMEDTSAKQFQIQLFGNFIKLGLIEIKLERT